MNIQTLLASLGLCAALLITQIIFAERDNQLNKRLEKLEIYVQQTTNQQNQRDISK